MGRWDGEGVWAGEWGGCGRWMARLKRPPQAVIGWARAATVSCCCQASGVLFRNMEFPLPWQTAARHG